MDSREPANSRWIKWIELSLVLVFLISGLIVALSSEFAVLNWFLTDDAFYYFKVAYNIGAGYGSTFDGVNLSNGYHPLWMLVCIPVFTLARIDLVLPLRVMIMISTGLSAASAVLLFRLLRRILDVRIALVGTVIWAFYLPLYTTVTKGGMESAISAFFIILLWERVIAFNLQESITLRQIWSIGLIAVFTFLSRLDNIFIVFFAGVWVWLRWWQPQGRVKDIWEQWRWRLKTGFAYYLPVTVVMLAYLGLNQWVFDSAMPVSSEVKLWWGTLGKTIYGSRLYIYTDYIFEYLLPAKWGVGPWQLVTEPLHTAAMDFWAKLGRDFTFEPLVITYGVVFAGLAAVLAPGWKHFVKLVGKLGLLPFFAATMVQSWYYFLRGSYNLRYWYWVSENLFFVLFLAVTLNVLFFYLRNFKYIEILRWAFAAGLSILMCFGLFQYSVEKTYADLGDIPHVYQAQVNKLRELIPPEAVIGGIGTGATGYFMPEYRVVNLDGLINSVDYLEHLKAGNVIDFLEENEVEYIFGSPYILTESVIYGDSIGPYLEFDQEYEYYQYTKSIWKVVYP